ncbi:MAG: glycosyltransferase family 2 protein [Patescibacteria group bacterium]|jgi:GT2 family glycosyltransferase
MTKARVSIIILTYNSQRHMPALFASLAKLIYPDVEVIVVDNASTDGTVDWLQHQTVRPVDQLIVNKTNVWFAQGNNQGIKVATGEYIYICNDDIILTPTSITRLVERMQQDTHCAMVGGKMLKLIDGQPSKIFDSAGLILKRSGRAVNRGEQVADTGQYDSAEEVFGITGAGMLLRRSAITSECFDSDFVAYKEDVDLSWRLHRTGYTVWYEPTAVIYHARSIQQTTLAGRGQKSALIRAMSYRNHIWLLFKNLSLFDWLKRLPWLLPYECVKLGYVLIFEWSTLRMFPTMFRLLPKMIKKRQLAL